MLLSCSKFAEIIPSKPHIAVNCLTLCHPLEGIGRFTYEIIKSWLEQPIEARLTLIVDRPVALFEDKEVDLVILKPRVSHSPSKIWWNEVVLTQWLKKNRPDIYLSPDGFIPLRVKIPCVPVVHDLAPLVYPQFMRLRDYLHYRAFQKKAIRRALHVFTVSEFSKKEIIQYVDVPVEKITVAYNGLASDFPIDRKISLDESMKIQSEDYFLYYGSLHPRKNILGLIHSYLIYRSNGGGRKLVIAGRSAWKTKEIDDLLEQSAYRQDIHKFDFLPADKLAACLQHAWALVYISHYEGFGLPVLEAMASGTPVITTSHSAMSEVGGRAVMTCHPLDHHNIARAMSRMDEDAEWRKDLIAAGKERASRFQYRESASIIYQKLLELIAHDQ